MKITAQLDRLMRALSIRLLRSCSSIHDTADRIRIIHGPSETMEEIEKSLTESTTTCRCNYSAG